MSLVRLCYVSQNRVDFRKGSMISQLGDVLDAAERYNARHGITGALVFDRDWFVQVLEGQLHAVWAVFDRLARDKRHSNIRFVEMKEACSRRFGDWWMGCAERNARTEPAFLPYLSDGRFAPMTMSADAILSLLLDLGLVGFQRRSADWQDRGSQET
jgi:hypothetical protein